MAPHLSQTQRERILALRLRGCRVMDICRETGITKKTVYFWLRRWVESGTLKAHHRQQYSRATTAAVDAAIVAAHSADPSLSTRVTSTSYSISMDTVRRRLKEARLQPKAGPSHNMSENDYQIKTSVSKSSTIFTDKKGKKLYIKFWKRMKSICELYNRIRKFENNTFLYQLVEDDDVNAIMRHKWPPKFALHLQYKIQPFQRRPKRRNWTLNNKITALKLYHRSPTCYRLLRRLFILPAPCKLKSMLKKFPFNEGLDNKKYFRELRSSVRYLEHSEKQFILMFDQVLIKKNVELGNSQDELAGPVCAIIFMIASLQKKLEQPVAYFFSETPVTASQLANYIKMVIQKCSSSKIRIAATVCHINNINKEALNTLGASVEHPEIVIDGREIVTLFDVPHLLKCFRNLFMEHDIQVNTALTEECVTGTARWSHIRTFFEKDHKSSFVFAPALTEAHLAPTKAQKSKVHLASYLLDHKVFIGLLAAIAKGDLPPEADITAILVARMNQLYESLTADNRTREGTSYDVNISNKSPHKEIFEKMKEFFRKLTFYNLNSKPICLEAWIWTMNGTEKLWTNLFKIRIGIRSLATKRLQKDPLVNLIKYIRINCGSKNLTQEKFVDGIKCAILGKLRYERYPEDMQWDDENNPKSESLIDDFDSFFYGNKLKSKIGRVNADLYKLLKQVWSEGQRSQGSSKIQAGGSRV